MRLMGCTKLLTAADRKAATQAPAKLDLIPMVSTQGVCAADHTDHVSTGHDTLLLYYNAIHVLLVLQQEFGDEGVRQLTVLVIYHKGYTFIYCLCCSKSLVMRV